MGKTALIQLVYRAPVSICLVDAPYKFPAFVLWRIGITDLYLGWREALRIPGEGTTARRFKGFDVPASDAAPGDVRIGDRAAQERAQPAKKYAKLRIPPHRAVAVPPVLPAQRRPVPVVEHGALEGRRPSRAGTAGRDPHRPRTRHGPGLRRAAVQRYATGAAKQPPADAPYTTLSSSTRSSALSLQTWRNAAQQCSEGSNPCASSDGRPGSTLT
ncbi:hypothetical protein DL771_000845 [Monosporascus sp. 5C6A]|nr:hypothetical protein DL771_000845 [Monosporascus sp. 5C6A]